MTTLSASGAGADAGMAAEPGTRVSRAWTTWLSLANLGLWMGYFGPLQVLLPNQMQDINDAKKTTYLGIATAFGALVAVLVGPIAGALSDAISVPIETLDLALANWGAPQRATVGFPPDASDDEALARATDALGL